MANHSSAHLADSALYSIQFAPPVASEATENTPLLLSGRNRRAIIRQQSTLRFYHRSAFTALCVTVLFVILILGIVSGIYLLLVEDYMESDPALTFSVVTRENWHAKTPIKAIPKAALPLERVVLSHTASEECLNQNQCKKLVLNLQKMHMEPENGTAPEGNEENLGNADIAYNFLVAGNGDIYEGRGWDYQCELDDAIEHNNRTLAVAFIGNYTNEAPPKNMLKVLEVLLQKAVDSGKLVTCFTLWIGDDFLQFFKYETALKSFPKKKQC